MGSYSDLSIAGYSVVSRKYRNAPEVLSIFVETDKVNERRSPDVPMGDESEGDDEFSGYRCTVRGIADRLELMGFTEEGARSDFALLLENEIAETSRRGYESWADGALLVRLRAEGDAKIGFLSKIGRASCRERV